MRPAIIATGDEDIHLVIGLGALLGSIERAVGCEVDALHIAVAVGEDVTAHALDLRIVLGNRTIQIEPQRLALVGNEVLGGELVGGRQPLCFDRDAPVAELVFAAIADGVVELAVRPDLHPARIVVIARRQPRNQFHRVLQRPRALVVGKPHDLGIEVVIRAVWVTDRRIATPRLVHIGVRGEDVVIARALEQLRIEGEAQQSVLAARR